MRAIGEKPNYLDAYVSLGQTLEKSGDIEAAIRVYEPIIGGIEQHPTALFELGRLFYNRRAEGDDARVLELWQRAVTLDPAHGNALYGLGLLYERQGEDDQALSYFERALALNPENEEIRGKVEGLR